MHRRTCGTELYDIIEYDSRTKTITILDKTRFAYIDCDKVECIEVYGN